MFLKILGPLLCASLINLFAHGQENFTDQQIYEALEQDCRFFKEYGEHQLVDVSLSNPNQGTLYVNVKGDLDWQRRWRIIPEHGLITNRALFNTYPSYSGYPVGVAVAEPHKKTPYYWDCRKTERVLELICGGSIPDDPHNLYSINQLGYVSECKDLASKPTAAQSASIATEPDEAPRLQLPSDPEDNEKYNEVREYLANVRAQVRSARRSIAGQIMPSGLDEKQKARLWAELCDADKMVRGCRNAAMTYNHGDGAIDKAKGREYTKKSCFLGIEEDCADWGYMAGRGEGGVKDLFESRFAFKEGCSIERDSLSCARLGEALYFGWGGDKDVTRGLALLRAGCENKQYKFACQLVR